MFDSITIRGLNATGSPDFGLLAESLVFYGHVNLVLNSGHLTALLRVSGYDVVRELFDMGALSITHLENGAGVRTTNGGNHNEMHDFVIFDMAKLHLQNCLPEILRELIAKDGKARRVGEQLKRNISTSKHTTSINDASLKDVATCAYVQEAIAKILSRLAPEYQQPEPFVFDVIRNGSALRVSTNLDFEALNAVYHKHVSPEHSTINTAYLLSVLHEATGELQMAASSNSEIALSPLSTVVAETRLSNVVTKRLGSENSLQVFQDFVFDDARAIREAVNLGHRNMKDVVALVESARKFKEWVRAKPEDSDSRKAYLKEIGALGWTETLPRKSVWWGIFTAAGIAISALANPIVGMVAGAGLNTLDYFFLDKLVQGWKPNQFIEGQLRKFVAND